MGKQQAAPPAPDYAAAARAQGASNVESAQATAKLSNPNIQSPYGSQKVTYGTPQFDQAGYDKAMAAYNSGAGTPSKPYELQDFLGYNNKATAGMNYGGQAQDAATQYAKYQAGGYGDNAATAKNFGFTYSPSIPSGTAPDKSAFTTYGGDLNIPNITQTLSPNSQAVLDAQQKTQLGLANLSNDAMGTAKGILSTPFQYQGPGVQTSLGPAGAIQNAPNANDYALRSSYDSGGQIQNAPTGSQYGTAGSIQGNQYGSAGGISNPGQYNANGQLNLSGIAAMPVNAGQTGQQAIMNRLNPQIQQGDASYANTLKNQGITLGSEAYGNAMRVHNQSNNDLLSQAALQGINLDMSANNQGYNQALSTGQFGNQAQAQNYGQNMGAQQLQNAAIGQNYSQGLGAQNQANAAIGQNYSQGLASMQAQNQAQQQQFGQNQSQFHDYNTSQLQQYQNRLAQMQAQNAAQNQGYNQNLQSGQFANTAQQQAYQQQLAQRQMPLNEIAAMMSGSQIQNPQFPSYNGAQVAPAPVFNAAQAQYNAGLQSAGMANANTNSMNSGLMGLGSAGMNMYGLMNAAPLVAASDRRLKSNIERIGTHPLGIGIYEYDIFGHRDVGVMADEVLAVRPEAVSMHPSGFMQVDYGRL